MITYRGSFTPVWNHVDGDMRLGIAFATYVLNHIPDSVDYSLPWDIMEGLFCVETRRLISRPEGAMTPRALGPYLTSINFSNLTGLYVHYFNNVGKFCPNLFYLNLRGSDACDTCLREVALNCHQLHHLDIAKTAQITTSSVRYVARVCKNLRMIVISENAKYREVLKELPALHVIL
eukprot:PhF_6_TR9715/c0_g1_i3/m.14953